MVVSSSATSGWPVAQRPHALRDGERASSSCDALLDDQLADLVGDRQHLVDADAFEVAGVAAEVAAGAGMNVRRSGSPPPRS